MIPAILSPVSTFFLIILCKDVFFNITIEFFIIHYFQIEPA